MGENVAIATFYPINPMDFHLDNLLNFPYVTVLSCQQKEEFIFLKLELLRTNLLPSRLGSKPDD